MQTILGAGNLGRELALVLPHYTNRIRVVGRNPQKINPQDELFIADLTDAEQTMAAVKGSDVAYLTVGLRYHTKTWQEQWPVVMRNVINACKIHKTKLVFFDNVYLYGKVDGWMTEDSPIRPASKKGQVRAEIAEMLMEAVRSGQLQALIARCADFYGPNVPTSAVSIMVFDNLRQGKKAQWMLNADVKHSLTYVPDAARALALLGNTEAAYNQVWHLPTDKNALTGKEFITLAAQAFGVRARYTVLSRWMLYIIGLFIGAVRENMEMSYQNDSDYLFDSSKFNRAFNFKVTSYQEGIMATVREVKQESGAGKSGEQVKGINIKA